MTALPYVIDPQSANWEESEARGVIAAQQKIRFCKKRGRPLPQEVFESCLFVKKNISTEVAMFDERGRIYLVRRETSEENPLEPYPGMLHVPGVTHDAFERSEQALARLELVEGIRFSNLRFVAPKDFFYDRRGMYLMLIHIADAVEATHPKGRFYAPDEIPWGEVISGSREVIIPAAFEAHRSR